MDIEAYRKRYGPGDAPGWDAIDQALSGLYQGAEPIFHFGTLHRYDLGGDDPLDGISVYMRRDPDHLHYVSYGLSKLYFDEESAGKEYSGWGFELTFRVGLHGADVPRTEGEGKMGWNPILRSAGERIE